MDERNWFRRLDSSWICDRMGEDFNCCPPHLIIDMGKDGVKISTYYCGRTIKTESRKNRGVRSSFFTGHTKTFFVKNEDLTPCRFSL